MMYCGPLLVSSHEQNLPHTLSLTPLRLHPTPPMTTTTTQMHADAYKRCSGRGFVAISTGQLLLNQHHPLLISEFTDNKDLINAASSSSFIPLWSGTTMVKHFRGLPVYDGGFANNQPCPPGVKTCVKVSISSPAW